MILELILEFATMRIIQAGPPSTLSVLCVEKTRRGEGARAYPLPCLFFVQKKRKLFRLGYFFVQKIQEGERGRAPTLSPVCSLCRKNGNCSGSATSESQPSLMILEVFSGWSRIKPRIMILEISRIMILEWILGKFSRITRIMILVILD